ncbi:MAG: hypothetical protein K2X93_06975 [Candidatus Obscuribacterales bacterium]|nr:hypothetical protein [Candidatus Obscuribacterales bacterium]
MSRLSLIATIYEQAVSRMHYPESKSFCSVRCAEMRIATGTAGVSPASSKPGSDLSAIEKFG